MTYAIELRSVSYRYPGRSALALKDVNLQISPGEFVLIVGASGCGKSTLMLCLNGLIPKILRGELSGQVRIFGHDVQEREVQDLVGDVGIVFQDPEAQLFNLVVEDEVAFAPESLMVESREIERRVDRYLKLVGLSESRLSYTYALSGGEKQRAALASVLAAEPRLLILDEPTSNQDPKGTRDFLRVVYGLAAERASTDEESMTIVAVEHQVEHLSDMVNRVVAMEAGTIVADGTPREIFGNRSLCSRLGLWTPQVCQVSLDLIEQGVTLDPLPLTSEEAVSAMRRSSVTYSEVPFEPSGSQVGNTDSTALVEVKNLSYAYGGGPPVLQDISLRVETGEFLAVVGANGSGKSSLMKQLVGLLRAQAGRVLILGEDIQRQKLEEITRRVGYVFQYPEHQFVTGSVYDEVAYSLRVRAVPEDVVKDSVDRVLERFHLSALRGVHPFTLSMGQKRRLSVATMLVVDQDLLILDEPTMGQDWYQTEALFELLSDLNRAGKTILIVTHDMQVVSAWARRVVVLDQGRLVMDCTPRELFAATDFLDETALLRPQVADVACQLAPGLDWRSMAITRSEFVERLTGLARVHVDA